MNESEGRSGANRWISDLAEEARSFPLRLGADSEEIRQKAASMAKHCARSRTLAGALPWCDRMGVSAPHGETDDSKLRRLCDVKWWRRKLFASHTQHVDKFAREFGLVHQRRGVYVSDAAMGLIQARRKNARLMLEQWEAVNELDQSFSLAELQDLSVSNPRLRRNEMMTRLSGTESRAREVGHAAAMFTVTCPSRFHAVLSASGKPNPRFTGLTPHDGAQYLNRVWANARRWLNQKGVHVYGIRVREPQHDGTPHDHLLLFAPADQLDEVIRILRTWALKDSPEEPGAQKYRFDVRRIDYSKGTATGYVAKYVSKNIDGYGVDADLYGNDAKNSAQRVSAWASVWRIRQFQFFGTPPVSLWRELRRVTDGEVSTPFAEAVLAADEGDWARYGKALDAAPLRLFQVWSDAPGAYGEPKGYQTLGVATADGKHSLLTRSHNWTIRQMVSRPAGDRNTAVEGFSPWSSVNNCTGAPATNLQEVRQPPSPHMNQRKGPSYASPATNREPPTSHIGQKRRRLPSLGLVPLRPEMDAWH
ncbi:replication endonuclease [Natronocella acetinitrilica]|uniref:replication endonuclease n=1 Tax=Natronocella acetinitrilica TaxID=414046 RepID=UPI00209D7CA9|nr:replication endonuclease [Natronocella acetinitrilica]